MINQDLRTQGQLFLNVYCPGGHLYSLCKPKWTLLTESPNVCVQNHVRRPILIAYLEKIYIHASVSAATEWHGGDLGEITADAMLRDGGKLAGQTLLPPEHPLPHQPQVASKKKYIIIM